MKTIPIPMSTQTVDMQTGEATESVTIAQMMPVKRGTCGTCATKHGPDQPHNAQSLFYQMRFHAENGRYPDWRDAMAHCPDEVRKLWTDALIDRGVDVAGGKVNPARSTFNDADNQREEGK